ncbi:MAG: hypothetical protein GY767_10585, partial [Shimia sp.]|nr:hypothetical protein [Shimia sp.]
MKTLRRLIHSRRAVLWLLVLAILLLLASPFLLRLYTALRYRDLTYGVDKVPARPVAIIFGARVMPSGRLSTMLRDRVATGADLYQA